MTDINEIAKSVYMANHRGVLEKLEDIIFKVALNDLPGAMSILLDLAGGQDWKYTGSDLSTYFDEFGDNTTLCLTECVCRISRSYASSVTINRDEYLNDAYSSLVATLCQVAKQRGIDLPTTI